MGLPTLKERFADPEIKALCTGMFLLDNPLNMHVSINYSTSIGLSSLIEDMREHLKNARRLSLEQCHAMSKAESLSSDSSSDASDTDSSSDISSSDSDRESNSLDDPRDRRSHRRSSTPPRQYRRDPPVADKMSVGSRHYLPVTVGSRPPQTGC